MGLWPVTGFFKLTPSAHGLREPCYARDWLLITHTLAHGLREPCYARDRLF